jgi:hypothetical protein
VRKVQWTPRGTLRGIGKNERPIASRNADTQ